MIRRDRIPGLVSSSKIRRGRLPGIVSLKSGAPVPILIINLDFSDLLNSGHIISVGV